MLRLIYIFFSIFTVLLLAGCGPGENAYNRANRAYARGDYSTSFKNYLYAANQDIVPAQYAVGYQYFYGQGTKRDEPTGIKWLQRAAHHSERAQYALYLIQKNRPAIPWTYQLNNSKKKKIKNNLPPACIIKVQCEK